MGIYPNYIGSHFTEKLYLLTEFEEYESFPIFYSLSSHLLTNILMPYFNQAQPTRINGTSHQESSPLSFHH